MKKCLNMMYYCGNDPNPHFFTITNGEDYERIMQILTDNPDKYEIIKLIID